MRLARRSPTGDGAAPRDEALARAPIAPAESTAPRGEAPLAPRRRPADSLPRWVRMALMGVLFFFFFCGSPVIALVLFPALRLTAPSLDVYRTRCTYLLHRGMRLIANTARALRIAVVDLTPLPPSVDPKKPYVLISNHPTFVDMIVLLGTFEDLTCVTSGRWSKHWALGRLLRSTHYLPGPGSGLPESEHMLDTMVAHLRAGHPLLVFPEGRRSHADQLRRFRRGAIEAATRADVPIVPVFLATGQPYLTKDVPIWRPPRELPLYRLEWLDVVLPAAFGHDAKAIHRHLEGEYQARFAAQLAQRRALAAP